MKNKTLNRRKFIQKPTSASLLFTIVPRFVIGGKEFTAPSEKLTVGFIGTGKQGRGLVNGFAKKAQVVAGADADSKKLALFKSVTEKLYAEANGQTAYRGLLHSLTSGNYSIEKILTVLLSPHRITGMQSQPSWRPMQKNMCIVKSHWPIQ